MKKCAIIIAICSSPAFAHQIMPQTEFFQNAVKQNLLTVQVLAWCGLVGLDEVACKNEIYEKDGHISDAKIDSVAKCVDASGLKYRVAMDKFFKTDINKQQQFSHPVAGGIWHLDYVADKNDGTSDKPHKHFYTDVDMQEAGRLKGMEYVRDLKDKVARDTITETTQLSGTGGASAGVIIAGGTATLTKGSETSIEKSPVTQKEIDAAYAKGEAFGKAHPETTAITPHGVCYKQGDCITPTKVYENTEYPKIEGVAGSTNPKPEVKPEAPKEDPKPPKEGPAKDPFAPILKDSDNGGVKTSDNETRDSDNNNAEGITTPVQDPDFGGKMQQCVQQEENKWYKNQGSKTEDPDAKTDEDEKREAEEKLARGECDESYYDHQFCHNFKNAQSKTEDENAEAKRNEAYEQALADFQATGTCKAEILGWEFCKTAKDELTTHHPEEESAPSALKDGWQVPLTNPANNGSDGWEGMSPDGPQQGTTPPPSSDCERDMWGDCKL